MRQIGSIADEKQAQRLADYLLTQGMGSVVEPDGQHWIIWIREENHVEPAKTILDDYLNNPEADKYRQAFKAAESIRTEEVRRRVQAKKNNVDVRTQWQQPLRRRAPLVTALIGLSIFCSIVTGFGQGSQRSGNIFNTLMFSDMRALREATGPDVDPLQPIKSGQVWRLITPIFLHGGLLHLFFNMYWMFVLAPAIEVRRGTVRFGLIVLILALGSNLLQYRLSGPAFLGMSGVVYGIFGYMWVKRLLGTDTTYPLNDGIIFLMLLVLALGFFGAMDGMMGAKIANGAHLGGLLAGMAIGYTNRL